MPTTSSQLLQAIEEAEQMAPGRAQVLRSEELVAVADEVGDPRVAALTRLLLINSYLHGDESPKIFTPFSWLLTRYDDAPDWFSPELVFPLLWHFKAVTCQLLDYPQVPLEQVEGALLDMENRYALAGQGQAPVLGARFRFTSHVHGAQAAEEDYLAWLAAGRTELSDCLGCEPTQRAAHLALTGRHREAVEQALPVLQGQQVCSQQPHNMIHTILASLLVAADPELAAHEHLRGVRLIRSREGNSSMLAEHIGVCGRAGQLPRGLDLLEEVLHRVRSAPVPWERMELAAHGSRLLQAVVATGNGDLPVRTTRAPVDRAETVPARQVLHDLTAQARELAAAFDERNGTTAVSGLVESWLGAEDLPRLPLDPMISRPRPGWRDVPARPDATGTDAAGGPADPCSEDPQPPGRSPLLPHVDERTTLVDFRTALERAWSTGAVDDADRLFALWKHVRERFLDSTEPTEKVWVAELEAAEARRRCTSAGAQADGDLLREAAHLQRAVGLEGPALLDEQQALLVDLTGGLVEETQALAQVRRIADELQAVGTPGEIGTARLRISWAVRLVGGPSGDIPEEAVQAQHRAREAFDRIPPGGLTSRERGRLALLRAQMSDDLEPEAAVDVLLSALELVPPGVRHPERAVVLAGLGNALGLLRRTQESAQAFRTAAHDSLMAGNRSLAASCFASMGHSLLATDPQGSVTAFSTAVPLFDETAPADWRADVRANLAQALRVGGRVFEAAEVAESGLAILEGNPLVDSSTDQETERHWFFAGRLAFLAALCSEDLGERSAAHQLAGRSAEYHSRHGRYGAQAEALRLFADTAATSMEAAPALEKAAELADAAGDPWFAAGCRRVRAGLLLDADGPVAALTALVQASDLARAAGADDPVALAWEQAALAQQRVRILAESGQFEAALDACAGLADMFRTVDDAHNARESAGLQAELLAGTDRHREAVDLLWQVAREALEEPDPHQARRLGSLLAGILDSAGDPQGAQSAWEVFTGAGEEDRPPHG
jgi:cellulose synthase operon protein C